jgi:hypothetical protein
MSMNLEAKLRVTGPRPEPAERLEERQALDEGRAMLRHEGEDDPGLEDVVWRLIQDAATTEARLPMDQRHGMTYWPDLARASEECRQVEIEQGNCVEGGHDAYGRMHTWNAKAYTPRFQITDPGATRRMLTVLGWLKHCRSRNRHARKRDIRILLLLARGVSPLTVSRMLRGKIGERAVGMVKERMLAQVMHKISLLDIAANCSK